MSPTIIQRPSPNFGARPAGTVIDCIVLHADAGTSAAGTLSWLAARASKVSYHYLVDRGGAIYQCVPDAQRAWHAGRSTFDGRGDCNDFSLGVSFANDQAGEPFDWQQLAAGEALVRALMQRHPAITPQRVTTHAIVSPGRKHDPGPLFPLANFVRRLER